LSLIISDYIPIIIIRLLKNLACPNASKCASCKIDFQKGVPDEHNYSLLIKHAERWQWKENGVTLTSSKEKLKIHY